MKYLIPFVLTALLFSCQQPVVEIEEPDGSIQPDLTIPAGIKTDTTDRTENDVKLDIVYAYPTDASESGFMQQLYLAVDDALIDFNKTIAHQDEGVNTFEATPINYYNNDNIVSIRYIFSSMNAGAVHGMTGLLSFNYDKQRHKPITWDDYFKFETKADSSLIIKLLDEEFLELRETVTLEDNAWEFYHLSHLDFHIRKDTLCFNFAEYQLGQGPNLLEYRVPKSKLQSLIRPDYR